MATLITLRPPTTSNHPESAFTAPPTSWLSGTWHVTHSTLPMWKSKRNVTITYKLLPPTTSSPASDTPTRLDDIVSYQTLSSPKVKTVTGIDTPSGTHTGAWDWRGKGILMIASSHWEVLGYGDLEAGHQWAVTFFAKTLFTPAGIDIYSRRKEGLGESVLGAIIEALAKVEHESVRKLAGEIFEVRRD
ncbi:hypothetical protein N7G274_001417 [Stereocaulon virgatum]|uniref:Uncharacterized protein n=1 Tax=Stereocaulon virgatum TaxID=373712 RepID=A0ABR4APB1_9LECA